MPEFRPKLTAGQQTTSASNSLRHFTQRQTTLKTGLHNMPGNNIFIVDTSE